MKARNWLRHRAPALVRGWLDNVAPDTSGDTHVRRIKDQLRDGRAALGERKGDVAVDRFGQALETLRWLEASCSSLRGQAFLLQEKEEAAEKDFRQATKVYPKSVRPGPARKSST